jgi:hypothetical protein
MYLPKASEGGDFTPPGPKPKPLADRFWAKVQKGGIDDCWLWTASKDKAGYGQIGRGSKLVPGSRRPHKASRVAWELTFGPVPDGVMVCHRCDIPSCVNPAHLFLGTQADNLADMTRKGRRIAQNSLKTHCKRGHPLSGSNLYVHPTGKRQCRQCLRLHWRNHDNRRRGGQNVSS